MTAIPTGTVTFLFTDIVGSSRLWEQQPQAMQASLGRHDHILHQAVRDHGGHIVKVLGDGVYAAFTTAADALRAALAAQRALHSEPWPSAAPIAVRCALHSGSAKERDGDYFGPAVNRAARLLAVAHGGQILLSGATQELVLDHLPADVFLRSIGQHRLKDLLRPEQVYQPVGPGLPSEFPPLLSLTDGRARLPMQLTPFIGREKELADCLARLRRADVRLLTITGAGGSGKTRLALQAAAELIEDFADGVAFVDLSAVRQPKLLNVAIAAALRVRAIYGQTVAEALAAYLREKQILLLLDNFEQIAAAAPVVSGLLAAAPRLKVLATSRAALHLSAEHEYPLSPLALPDVRHLPSLPVLSQYEAVELFIQRSQAVNPAFAISNANAPAVAEVCVRLDGLPLAIELAAARSRMFSPQDMLAQVQHSLRFLTDGARDLPARQQTLRGAICWSYDLLTEDVRRLFRRLGVCSGGWTLAAAEALGGSDALAGLSALVGASLARRYEQADGGMRFVFLGTVREFALERLAASGEEDEARRAHALYFLRLAEEVEPKLHGPKQRQWLDRVQQELDNLRAALSWAVEQGEAEIGLRMAIALRDFWERRHLGEEAWAHFQALLALPGAEAATRQLHGLPLSHAAAAAKLSRQLQEARRLAQEAIALGRQSGDRLALAQGLSEMVSCSSREEHKDLCMEAVALLREVNDPWRLAHALHQLAIAIFGADCDLRRCEALTQESLALARLVGDKYLMMTQLRWLALYASHMGDAGRQRAMARESMILAQELGDRLNSADARRWCHVHSVAHEERVAACKEAAAVARELGFPGSTATFLCYLAEALFDSGALAEAQFVLDDALAISARSGDTYTLARAYVCLGRLALLRRQPDQALPPLRLGLAMSLRQHASSAYVYVYARTLAHHAAAVGAWQRTARLLGAAYAFQAKSPSDPGADEAARLEQTLAAVRAHVDSGEFDRLWAEGQAMTPREAGEYALREIDDQPAPHAIASPARLPALVSGRD